MTQWNKYEPTAARRHGKPGREARPQSITIDIHSHVAVPAAAAFVKPHFDPIDQPAGAVCERRRRARSTRSRKTTSATRITGYDQRLAELDAMGIDIQLVMPPPPQCYYTVPVEIAVEAARIVNDGIAEFVAGKPDRFAGLGSVPMPDGNEAAKELERCVSKLGLKGVQILTNVDRPGAVRSGLRAVLEEGRGARRARRAASATASPRPSGFARFSFNNTIGNPLETTIALHYLIFDGVLERHPNLKILAVHGGGYLGAYSGPHRSRLGRALGCARQPAASADQLSQEDLFRLGRVHAGSACGAGAALRRRPHHHGHRLSVRHGGLRSDRPRGVGGVRCGHCRGDCRRQCEAAAWGCSVDIGAMHSPSSSSPKADDPVITATLNDNQHLRLLDARFRGHDRSRDGALTPP